MLKYEESRAYKPELRASSMPFCPRKFIYSFFNNRSFSFASDFYMDVGTAIHSVVQHWLPIVNHGVLFGNWECLACKNIRYMKIGPLHCNCCGAPLEYKELTLTFPSASSMSGHSDGLLIEGKKAWILELKSTGTAGVSKKSEPDKKHDLQATVYVSALREIFEIMNIELDVKGYCIKYISRDNPRIVSPDFVKEVDDDSLYKLTTKLVNNLVTAITENKVSLILKQPCDKHMNIYDTCEFMQLCSSQKEEAFKKMFKQVRKELNIPLKLKTLKLFI